MIVDLKLFNLQIKSDFDYQPVKYFLNEKEITTK